VADRRAAGRRAWWLRIRACSLLDSVVGPVPPVVRRLRRRWRWRELR